MITKLYILINVIIAVFIILEKLPDQLVKNIPSDVFYNILDYILNNIVKLNLRLTVFYNDIAEFPEFYKVLKEDI